MPIKYDCHYVYIVVCSDGTFYTGMTVNLDRRIRQHNGLYFGGSKYVRARRPAFFVYVERFDTRKEADAREREIKNMTRAEKETLISLNTRSIS
jgi:putative endonuclease